MISSVATAAAAKRPAQERRRPQLQLLGDGGQEKPAPSSSSEESLLDAHGEEEIIPATVATLEAGAQLPAGATCDSVPDELDGNSVAEQQQQQQPADRAPAIPTAGKQSKKLLKQSTEPVSAPGAAGRPQQQDPAAAQRRAPVTAAPTNTVARLVDAVLKLTNERFGASLRVQLKLADEVVQGVAEAVDESERGETSVSLSLARTTRLSTATSAEYMLRPALSPKFAEQVENVYKFDLMEDNPNWKTFLTSSTDFKAQAWEARRQAASNPLRKALYSKHREWIYMTLSYPDHSRLAYWVGVFVIGIILLNTITFCIESVPHYAGTPLYNSLTIVDYVCMGIFTAEYFLRLLCCPDLCRFLRSFSNLIDVVAILPFYVELCVTGTSNEAFQTRVVRLLRVFRVLRIVKTMPKLRHLTLVSETLRDSVEVLIMLACLLLVLLVVFGTIIFFVEPSTFDSIPQAMYYAQTTLTTTGYGDIYPVTPWGRFVAGAAMLFCMVVVSLPIAVIGGNFSEKWTDYKSFKAAVDRSSRVHPTARALRSELERYEGVLDDVMKRLQECEVASEKQLLGVREELATARAALLRGGAAAAGLGGPPGGASAELALVPAPSGAAGLLSKVKIVARRARDNSSATRGTASNGYGMPAAVESLQGSVASLVDLAEGSGHGGSFAGANGIPESSASGLESPRHQAELRSEAALTARNGPQPLSAEAEEETGAAKGLGSGFRAVVARVMKHHARASGPAADGDVAVSERQGSGGGSGNFGGAPHANAAGNPFAAATTAAEAALASTDGPSKATDASRNAAVVAAAAPPPQPSPAEGSVHPLGLADAGDGDFALQLPLPPPPPPPAAPPPPPPPPRPPGVYSQPSLAAAPASASLSLGGLALQFTNSISSILGRRGGGAAATAATAAADDSAAAAPPLPMDPVALDFATVKLAHAGAGCKHARDLRVRHETLAAQAQILRSDDMPLKLEKLDEQYRLVRCWQDELGPMAERMWGLRDALDQLAWALQEGLPEERCSYEPADKAARAAADEALGVMRRRPAVGGEESGSVRGAAAGPPGAGEAARRDGAGAVVLSLK